MGGGGKGGEQSTKIDKKLTEASRDALDRASTVTSIPYIPNRGVQIAAFTPTQEAAMQGNNSLAASLGLKTSSPNKGMPPVETINGVRGYSTGAVYDDAMRKSLSPAMKRSIDMLFANRETGDYYDKQSPLATSKYGGSSGKSSPFVLAQAGSNNFEPYDPNSSVNRK